MKQPIYNRASAFEATIAEGWCSLKDIHRNHAATVPLRKAAGHSWLRNQEQENQ